MNQLAASGGNGIGTAVRVAVLGTSRRSKRRMRILAAAVCFLPLASTPSAAEPELVKLAVSEGKDIRFAHLTSKDGLSPGQIRDILQDDQGFLMVQHLGRAEPVRRLPVQIVPSRSRPTRTIRPGAFSTIVFKDRSGFLWIGSNESLDRFDPVTETSTRFADRPQRSGQCPRAGLAHQPGSGRDIVAGHRGRPAPAGSRERHVPPLCSRSG